MDLDGANSPIHTLPPEILSQIFRNVRDNWGYGEEATACSNFTAVTLSHVCMSWRNAIFEDTGMWSDIELRFRDSEYDWKSSDGALSFVKLCLEKSGDRHLDIDLRSAQPQLGDFEDSIDEDTGEILSWSDLEPCHHAAMGELAKVAHRWRNAALFLQGRDSIDLPAELPHLRTLWVHVWMLVSGDCEPSIFPNHDIFLPSLTNLHFTSHNDVSFLSFISAPALVQLNITSAHKEHVIHAFRLMELSAKTMKEVSLNSFEDTAHPLPHLALPRVDILSVGGAQNTAAARLLEHLSLPALTHLGLNVRYTFEGGVWLLSKFPTVVSLNIGGLSTSVVLLLTVDKSSSACAFPNLAHLTVRVTPGFAAGAVSASSDEPAGSSDEDEERNIYLLYLMLRSRLDLPLGVQRLLSFEIHIGWYTTAFKKCRFVHMLECLGSEGLNVIFPWEER